MKNSKITASYSSPQSFAWSMYASIVFRLIFFLTSFIPKKFLAEKEFLRFLRKSNIAVGITNGCFDFIFPVNGQPIKFYLRKDGSDIKVFQQVVLGKAYQGLVQLYGNRKDQPFRIIDAGSNIGLAAIFLKRNFPASIIICLEPQEGNFELLQKNIESNNLESIYPYKKALWSKSVVLQPRGNFRDNLDWSFAVEESDSSASSTASIDGITLAQLTEMHGWETIDILKIDIEGAEAVLFTDNDFQNALSKVKVIAVEIHEEMIKKEKILEVLWRKNFLCIESGDMTIAINRTWFKSDY